MVNQVILNYFKENRAEHSLEDLKKKVLNSGYPREDVDEALVVLRKGVDKTVAPKVQAEGIKVKKEGVKWMKIAGILGFVFLGLMIISAITSLIIEPSSGTDVYSGVSPLLIFVLVVMLVSFVSVFVYLYGFLRLGRYADSKLIRITVVSAMILPGIMILLLAGAFLLPAIFMWILAVFIIIGVAQVVFFYMFSIGLIKIGNKVEFAKVAGIFGLCSSVLATIAMLSVAYITFNPMILFEIMESSVFLLMGYNILSFASGFFMTLFASLALLNASKKYE